MDGTERRAVVVVGVDGSEEADTALRFAMEEARRRGGSVRTVTAVRPPELFAYETYALPDPAEVQAAAVRDLEHRIQEIREHEGIAVEAEVLVVAGSPVPVLVDAARDADLLVVGHRGRGPWRSAVLGSVGLGAVLHAPCPVTVLPRPVPATGTSHTAREPAAPLTVGPTA